MILFKVLFLFQSFFALQAHAEVFENKEITSLLKSLPVHDRGRVKPLDTFARESIEFIRGRSHSQSLHWLVTWILLPEQWDQSPFMLIQSSVLRKALNLNPNQSAFSPYELFQNENLKREVAELQSRKIKKLDLSSYFLEIEKLESRLILYQAIRGGFLPLWIPQGEKWVSATEFNSDQRTAFMRLLEEYTQVVSTKNSNLDSFRQTYKDFKSLSENQVHPLRIGAEIHYNSLNPFRWSWLFYLLSLVLWFCLFKFQKYRVKVFFGFSIIAFILNTYGMLLRSFIMERPPVSNMYETLIWVPWVAYLIALVFLSEKRSGFLCWWVLLLLFSASCWWILLKEF